MITKIEQPRSGYFKESGITVAFPQEQLRWYFLGEDGTPRRVRDCTRTDWLNWMKPLLEKALFFSKLTMNGRVDIFRALWDIQMYDSPLPRDWLRFTQPLVEEALFSSRGTGQEKLALFRALWDIQEQGPTWHKEERWALLNLLAEHEVKFTVYATPMEARTASQQHNNKKGTI